MVEQVGEAKEKMLLKYAFNHGKGKKMEKYVVEAINAKAAQKIVAEQFLQAHPEANGVFKFDVWSNLSERTGTIKIEGIDGNGEKKQ